MKTGLEASSVDVVADLLAAALPSLEDRFRS